MSADTDQHDEPMYHGYLAGRPTRTAEVSAPGGTSTIEEGTLTFVLADREDIREARIENGWTDHFVGPEGGVGFGLDEGNPGGVVVPYDLVEVIPFPRPMTEDEADEWFDNDQMWEWAEEHDEVDADAE